MEIFKDIKGYEGLYQISNLGNVKSLDRLVKHPKSGYLRLKGRTLKKTISKRGYETVCLYNNGYRLHLKVHQLVYEVFKNVKPNKYNHVIDHINNIKTDNRLCNLQKITVRENSSKDKDKSKTYSKYLGVTWDKSVSKWKSAIYLKGRNKHLGNFDNEIDAKNAYLNFLKNV